MISSNLDIKIVIGSWGSYNACNSRALGSTWLDLSKYTDWEQIEEELKKQGFKLEGIDEELFIQDMADGESLIFFIRNATTPEIPFVTLEYSVQKKAVLQCYAYGNKKPNDTVMNFVNNIWLPYANKQLAKIKRTKIKAA